IRPEQAAELAAALREAAWQGRPAPLVAAGAAAAVTALRADAEPLALFCADAALAKSLGWPVPVPLLAGELFLRHASGEGRRPRRARRAGASSPRSLTRGRRSPL